MEALPLPVPAHRQAEVGAAAAQVFVALVPEAVPPEVAVVLQAEETAIYLEAAAVRSEEAIMVSPEAAAESPEEGLVVSP